MNILYFGNTVHLNTCNLNYIKIYIFDFKSFEILLICIFADFTKCSCQSEFIDIKMF